MKDDAEPEHDEQRDPLPLQRMIVIGVLTVLVVMALASAIVFTVLDPPTTAAAFGDSQGAVNALFSGLAFAGVIAAILLQKRELGLQREELKCTRSELAGQRLALEAQQALFTKRAFEDTFFRLLSTQQMIVAGLTLARRGHEQVGRICFAAFYNDLHNIAVDNAKTAHGQDLYQPWIHDVFLLFYKLWEPELAHYFEHLYRIADFIASSTVDNQQFYANLVRAQLSSDEKLLLFYYCLRNDEIDRFKPLVERFALLERLSVERLLRTDHFHLYAPTAFGHFGRTQRRDPAAR